tara:strand:- start:124 stop:387 length:264 start_codon:yes stop_codon:yes gene_type:complete
LKFTSANFGGIDINAYFSQYAQTPEDGATGIIRSALDSTSQPGSFYGPKDGWFGYPYALNREDMLSDNHNINTNWEGCEKAAGAFTM